MVLLNKSFPSKLKILLVCLIIISSYTHQSFAASLNDSTTAHEYYKKGRSFLFKGTYDSSAYYFKLARNLQNDLELWPSLIKSMKDAAVLHANHLMFDTAKFLITSINQIASDHSILTEELAQGNHLMGNIYKVQGQYKKASKFYQTAIGLIHKKVGHDNIKSGISYLELGDIYLLQGRYGESMTTIQISIDIFNRLENKLYLLSRCYYRIARIHDKIGSYKIALEYYLRAINIWKQKDERILIFHGLHGVALMYFRLGYLEKSFLYSNKSSNALKALKNYNGNIADYLLLKGALFLQTQKLDSSIYYLQKSLQKSIDLKEENSTRHALINDYLGEFHQSKKDYDKAGTFFNKSLSTRMEILGMNHKDIGRSFNKIAANHFFQKEYYESIFYFNEAIRANSLKKDIENTKLLPENSHSHEVMITSILGISNSHERIAIKENNIKQLLKSSIWLQRSIAICDLGLHGRFNFEDKFQLSKTISQIYEAAIRVNLKLYHQTQEEKYKLQAFYYSEKSKAGVLTEALNNMSAKRFGTLPDNVLTLEKNIKIDQSYFQTRIQNEKVKQEGYDTLEVATWEDKLFTLNRQSDSLILALEKNYPRYHELKYQSNILSVEETQEELNQNELLLEYFVGKEQTYLFTLTKNSYEIHTIENDSSRQDQIINFRKNLQASIMGGKVHMEDYATQAHDIYKKLLEPALTGLDSSINKFIIIPDADLGYIPFDILITEDMTDQPLSYQTLPYLLRDYQTQYGYSASLLFNDFEQKKRNFDQQFLAFAPQYEDLEIDSVRGLSLGKFRDQVTSLKYNTPEVNRINEYMDGLTFTGIEAREEAFKKYAGNSSILHLAMHAFVDDENPMNSKLVFTQANDTIEDNFLHAYELYNMELPADLAVLSACETGFGKLEKGEGIMSLARAFSYAGCPSVVMSHWSVNDGATAKLMGYFYKNLSEGMHKDAALQQAKLAFLKAAGPAQANPFFWGSFVVMGNTDPIQMVKRDWWHWGYLVGLLVLMSLVGILWRRSRERS